VHEIAVSQYQGIMLWAACVKKAGSLDREKMLAAIESGVSIQGPGGTVTLDPKTHHAILDINVMEVKNQKLTIKQQFKARPPSDTLQFCDLQKNPKDNKQYEVKI
jgi:branched-chain amino acid transport system substrate-binding protein